MSYAKKLGAFADAFNKRPRRVDVAGFIRWYVNNVLVIEVTAHDYYRDGHVHPAGCTCDALIHSAAFAERLRVAGVT